MRAPTRLPAPVTIAVRSLHRRRTPALSGRGAAIAMTSGMPERRPPIELQGISLAELQKLIDERRLPPVDQWNPRALRPFATCASPATAPGITKARRSAARRWSACSRPCCGASRMAATCSSRRSKNWTSTSKATAFRATRNASEGEGRDQRIAFALDSGDAVILGPEHPLRIVETEAGPSPRLLVRHGLEAELARPVYYELAELALAGGEPARRLERRRVLPAGGDGMTPRRAPAGSACRASDRRRRWTAICRSCERRRTSRPPC